MDTPGFQPQTFIATAQVHLSKVAIGPKHVLFKSITNGSLFLAVFVSCGLIWHLSVPQSISVITKAVFRTKGAVAICFVLFGTSFLFISSHLRAGENSLKNRVKEYGDIVNGLRLPKSDLKAGYNRSEFYPLNRFDCIFWAGDLNFRIQNKRCFVENIIGLAAITKNYEDLLVNDELAISQLNGVIFHQFEEGRIRFPPTYKYDIDSELYDSSDKRRTPSYTDRILFKSRRKCDIVCLEYNSINKMKCSDHKPVYGVYNVMLRAGFKKIPMAAGLFDRHVYQQGTIRWASNLINKNSKKFA